MAKPFTTLLSLPDLLEIFLNLIKCLKELVECNICFDIPAAQTVIYQCINGHIVCSNCYTEYNKLRSADLLCESLDIRHQPCCPVCRTSQFGMRSLTAERVVANVNENIHLNRIIPRVNLCIKCLYDGVLS